MAPILEAGSTLQEQTVRMLQDMRFPVYRIGYKQLCIGIPHYYENGFQSLSKDLYPWLAKQFDHVTPEAVEHAIREVIHYAWEHREPEVWERYFPGAVKPPSNKQFIATLAEQLK